MNAIDIQFLICGSVNEVTLCNSVAKKMYIQKFVSGQTICFIYVIQKRVFN